MKSGVAVIVRVAASARSTAPKIPPDRVNRVPAPTPRHFSAPRLEVWSSISGLAYLRVASYQTGRAAVLFPLASSYFQRCCEKFVSRHAILRRWLQEELPATAFRCARA